MPEQDVSPSVAGSTDEDEKRFSPSQAPSDSSRVTGGKQSRKSIERELARLSAYNNESRFWGSSFFGARNQERTVVVLDSEMDGKEEEVGRTDEQGNLAGKSTTSRPRDREKEEDGFSGRKVARSQSQETEDGKAASVR